MNGFWVCYGMIACMFAFCLLPTVESSKDHLSVAVASATWPLAIILIAHGTKGHTND